MSQGCWHVKPSEIRRMIETVKATGLHVTAVEVTKDGFKIETAETAEIKQDNTKPKSEWD
jgi:hypothetical protein